MRLKTLFPAPGQHNWWRGDHVSVYNIDFGGMGVGDPACDLVIAWTFLNEKSREIFKKTMALDDDTWLRAKAWALWKATFELCQIQDKNSDAAYIQKSIINEVLK